MRVFAVAMGLSLVLAAASTSAQTPAPATPRTQPPATTPAPRPQTQTPATPRQPDPPPAGAVQPPPAPAAKPFREGAKFGYVNVQAIASQSAEGRAAAGRIQAFRDQRQKELTDKQNAMKAAQQKLDSGGALLNDSARAQQEAEIGRMTRELQRLAEDADQDMERLQQQLQQEFMVKLQPAITRVGNEKGVDFIFSNESGLVFAAEGLDLTADVIRSLDGGAAAARPAGAAPAATVPAPTPPPAATVPPK